MFAWIYITTPIALIVVVLAVYWVRKKIQNSQDSQQQGYIQDLMRQIPSIWALFFAALGTTVYSSLVAIPKKEFFIALNWSSSCLIALVVWLTYTLIPAKWGILRKVIFTAWIGFIWILFVGDLIYVRQFGNIVPVFAASSAGMLGAVGDSMIEQITNYDWFLLPLLLGSIAVLWLPIMPKNQQDTRKVWQKKLVPTVLALSLSLGSIASIQAVYTYLKSQESWKVFRTTDSVAYGGVLLSHYRDILRSLREESELEELSDTQRADINAYFQEQQQQAASVTAKQKEVLEQSQYQFGAEKGSNLLIIQVEGMQRWTVGALFQGQEITPFLSKLRGKGTFYNAIYDQTGGSPTSDCEYEMLNSLHALEQGSVTFRRPNNHFVTIAHALVDEKYTTFSAHAFARGMWNRAILHPNYGFQSSAFDRELGTGPKVGWGISDDLFFERALPMIQNLPEPYFGFLITLTSHHPYKYIPKELERINIGPLKGHILGNYMQSMAYVDGALERFWTKLADSGILKNTTVVIYGDHDAKIKFGADITKKIKQNLWLEDDTVESIGNNDVWADRIPLLIIPPQRTVQLAQEDGQKPVEEPTKTQQLTSTTPQQRLNQLRQEQHVVDTVGGQINIGPTILYRLGVSRRSSFLGLPLLPAGEAQGYAARLDGAAVGRDWVYAPNNGGACFERKTRRKVAPAVCAAGTARAQRELEQSWRVTLHDLAGNMVVPKHPTETPETRTMGVE